MSSLQSLDLILEDVSAEINLSINSLEQYRHSSDKAQSMEKCLSHLNKLKGVFTILEMQGALRLITECIAVVSRLTQYDQTSQTRLLEALSTVLARLMRYNEYINQKPFDLPQLLLPAINFLRSRTGSPELGESIFFNCQHHLARPNKEAAIITTEEIAGQSRYIRQMYQIGLIEVLRKTNLSGGLRMMKKAMAKLDDQCIRAHSPNLWWVAQGMLEAFISEDLTLSQTRFKLFSRLDKQIRDIENKSNNSISDNKLEINLLTKEIIYLVWISGTETPTISAIFKHLNIEKPEFNDELLKKEAEDLRGPSDQDYQSLSKALSEEVSSIELSLNQYFTDANDSTSLDAILKKMLNLKNLLNILKVDDQIVRLNVAIDIVQKAQDAGQNLEEKDANILMIIIDTARS